MGHPNWRDDWPESHPLRDLFHQLKSDLLDSIFPQRRTNRLRVALSGITPSEVRAPQRSMFNSEEPIQELCRAARSRRYFPPESGLRNLGNLVETRHYAQRGLIAVTELDGIGASKSYGYESLADFAQRNFPERSPEIGFTTEDDFRRNREWLPRDLDAALRAWDGHLFLLQSDGSHHLAALFRQCADQGRDVELECDLREVRLAPGVAAEVTGYARILFLAPETYEDATRVLATFKVYDELHSVRISRFPGSEWRVLAIPHAAWWANPIYDLLGQHGSWDFTAYLKQAVHAQEVCRPSPGPVAAAAYALARNRLGTERAV